MCSSVGLVANLAQSSQCAKLFWSVLQSVNAVNKPLKNHDSAIMSFILSPGLETQGGNLPNYCLSNCCSLVMKLSGCTIHTIPCHTIHMDSILAIL